MSSARKRQKQQRVSAKLDGLNQAMMLERHYGDVLNTMATEIARRHDTLHALLKECAPHVFSAAEAEHLLDGFRPQRRPLDDLADRVRAALEMPGDNSIQD